MADLPPGFTLDAPPSLRPGGVLAPVGQDVPPGFKLDPPPVPPLPAQPESMGWGDFGRALGTMGVRGLTGVIDTIADPLSPIRRLISPEMERIEQQGSVHPGQMLGNAIMGSTGLKDFEPTSPMGRVGMSAGTGASGGRLFGPAGMVLGGLSGALAQVAKEATGSDRAETAAGLVPGLGAALMGRRAASRSTPELEAAGVNPTFGQAMGGWVNRLEQGFGSIPWVGDFIKSGRRGAIEEYNRGYINRALGHVGEQLDPNTPLGRPAITEADTLIGNRYDAVTPQITNFNFDPQFATGLARINRDLGSYPQAVRDQFANVIQTEILDRMTQPGGLTGQAFRDAESTLGQIASDNRNSPFANERRLGNATQRLQTELRDQLRRSNPHIADELTNIHRAYSEMLPIDVASSGLGTGLGGQSEAGVVTPRQLTAGVRAVDPTLRHRAFRQGTAVGQEYAEPGIRLLGDNLPDSGTPYRSLAALFGSGAIGAPFLDPATLATGVGAGLGMGALYSAPGRAALNYFLRRPEQSAASALALPTLRQD